MARLCSLVFMLGAILGCSSAEEVDTLDSVAFVQSRMHSRPSEAATSESFDRCGAPRRGRCSKRQIDVHEAPPSSKIVITRTKGEDLRWLDALPEIDAVIFNRKGLDELLPAPRFNLDVVRQEEDPLFNNLSPEDGMLRYIVENYDSLTDVTLFLQGWPFQHCADARDVITRAVLNARRPYDLDFVTNGAEAGLLPLSSKFTQYDVEEGRVGHAQELVRDDPKVFDQHIGVEAIAAVYFNKTCAKLLRRHCQPSLWFAQGSQWAVTRERIQQMSKENYEHALQVPLGASGKLKDVVLEAVWPLMWATNSKSWNPGMALVRVPAEKSNLQVKSTLEAMSNFCVFSTDGGVEKDCEEDAGFCLYAKSIGQSVGAEVELRPVMRGAELEGVCPMGYTFDDGSIPGLDAYGQLNIKGAIADCAELCDAQEGCLAFEWSAKTKVCNLRKGANPTAGRFADFLFCRSNMVPESMVEEFKPEKKVPAFLEGKISAPRARELRAQEEEVDLILRTEKAFRQTAPKLNRRLFCMTKSLSPPPLAVVDKKWRLIDVGYPYFNIQVADQTNCLTEPAEKYKKGEKPYLPCASKKSALRWELRKANTTTGFQLVSKRGKCLVQHERRVGASECEPEDTRQIFQLDLERTGKYYDKMSLEMTESDLGRLHMHCVTQLNGQDELVEPRGMDKSQIVRFHLVNASETDGAGAYFISRIADDGKEGYLGCRAERRKPEVVLQEEGYAWYINAGQDGAVTIESKDGTMLQYDDVHGGLFCLTNREDFPGSDSSTHLLFTLGLPQSAGQML